MKNYTAVVERNPDTGLLVGYVPGLHDANQLRFACAASLTSKKISALLLMFGILPPMQVSSASIRPKSCPQGGFRLLNLHRL